MSNDKSKRIPTWLIPNWLQVVFCIAIAVAVLLISLYFWKFSNGLAEKQDVWGQFGDYVGGILNPLFSLTALIALLYTIHLQSKELHESTEQLKASAEALALQNSVMMRQQFETTFFQMLGLFNEVVNNLYFASKQEFKGKQAISNIYLSLKKYGQLTTYIDIYNEPQELEYRKLMNHEYSAFFKEHDYLLDNYFRTLHSIIKFVDNSNLTNEDKKFYTNIIRAQLSKHELALLFYNCICLNDAREKFLPLVKKYKLLKNIDEIHLANPVICELLSLQKPPRS